jgi:electron transport complex protein RnfE
VSVGQRTTAMSRALLHENPATVQLLGLCPLLAVSHTLVNAIGLALATLFVLLGANTLISLLRNFIPSLARLPAFMLIIAGFTTVAVRLLEAFAFDLYVAIALFVKIITTNCIILSRAERAASRLPVTGAVLDAVGTGLGFAWVLLLLGAVREMLGHGSLGAGLVQLFGGAAAAFEVHLSDSGVLIAVLPPGAFLATGLLLAALNSVRSHRAREDAP